MKITRWSEARGLVKGAEMSTGGNPIDMAQPSNILFFGDNLNVLRDKIADASVDLIYLDPPFNSNRNYFVLFKDRTGAASRAQEEAFTDTWTWTEESERWYKALVFACPNRALSTAIRTMRALLQQTPMMAYLVAMAIRLVEMHRVLKPTGSLYLHCDPTASHYLRIVLDCVFEPNNFRNEIIWKRTSAHSSAKKFSPVHDTIFFYSKSGKYVWHPAYQPLPQETIDNWYNNIESETGRQFNRADLTAAGVRSGPSGAPWRGINPTVKGRHWAIPGFVGDIVADMDTQEALDALDAAGRLFWPKKEGGMPMLKRYLDEAKGIPALDVVTDINPLNNVASERLGYPTQKPSALLERILSASSNPGDIVLDPFCGCGTTVTAAQKLGRRWIGIDVTAVAVGIIKARLEQTFPELKGCIPVDGFPTDLEGARTLFEMDPYRFQAWACTLIGAYPLTKKGPDGGIDGWLNFIDFDDTPHRAIVQVKGGNKVGSPAVQQLRGAMEKEKATIGFFVCLGDATKPMITEAASAGLWSSAGGKDYPRLQILTIADLLSGSAAPKMPLQDKKSLLGYSAKVHVKGGQKELFD